MLEDRALAYSRSGTQSCRVQYRRRAAGQCRLSCRCTGYRAVHRRIRSNLSEPYGFIYMKVFEFLRVLRFEERACLASRVQQDSVAGRAVPPHVVRRAAALHDTRPRTQRPPRRPPPRLPPPLQHRLADLGSCPWCWTALPLSRSMMPPRPRLLRRRPRPLAPLLPLQRRAVAAGWSASPATPGRGEWRWR